MTWWQWTLAVLVLTAGLAFGAFRWGVTTQRRDDADARLRLAASLDSTRTAHASQVSALKVDVSRFSTLVALAESRAKAAESTAQRATEDVLTAQDALRASQTTADSLRAYPAVVDALTRQVTALDSARLGYRDALAASQERAGLLLARIATDSVLIERQRDALGKVTPTPPPSKSGWGCVAGVGAVTGVRTGLGVGVTCGRRL